MLTHSVHILTIQPTQARQRIDNFLISQLKGVPKSRIYRCLRRGEVRVNKARVPMGYRLKQGDQVRIPPLRVPQNLSKGPIAPSLLRQIENSLLYENNMLLILNKPAGVPVHGGSGVSYGVIEGLRRLRPKAPFLELVHRIDRQTSGCLIIAKERSVLLRLQDMQKKQRIHKSYLALVKGRWQRGVQQVSRPLSKNRMQSGERVVKISAEGKPAVSHFRPQQLYSEATLMEVTLETGRTHQIRVHAASLQHPLGGDEKYGDTAFNKKLRSRGLHRLFLHARRLALTLPGEKKALQVTAPLPEDLHAVLKTMHSSEATWSAL